MNKIHEIARVYFEAATEGKDPFRATDGMAHSLKELKKGRALGRELLCNNLISRGFSEKGIQEILSDLGI